ncbi:MULTISPECIES: hypothetical protein [unclassified Mesorhizobium]|uniref:hypothetical protein n=1 Tax=unclassified Mesorhizobium TaxID=325217 RepID=UPI00112CD7A8|nr:MULTISPECIES: hypothetical protein [unclassified Mesorhizobium]TPJ86938.1 hypothetical protein FJ489_30765 [Mesorhizobium sp. B2-5-12]TPK19161.1 hypothetical protein FJ562_31170 [Mesorhizobium sp. B2-5-6]
MSATKEFSFDHSFKPHREGLIPQIAAAMDRAWYSNRSNGFNVQFIRDDGARDEWSFNSRLRAEIFADNLASNGKKYAFSA